MDDEDDIESWGAEFLSLQRQNELCARDRMSLHRLEEDEQANCKCLPFVDHSCEWNMRVLQGQQAMKYKWGLHWRTRGTEQYIMLARNKLDPTKTDELEAWVSMGFIVAPYLDRAQNMALVAAAARLEAHKMDLDEKDDNDRRRATNTPKT